MRRFGGVLLGLMAFGLLASGTARASDLSFELWRLGDPSDPNPSNAQRVFVPNADNPSQSHAVLVPYDPRAQERFARFATDLAFAVTPLPAGPSNTSGDAGLNASFSLDFAFIHPVQKMSDGTVSDIWPTASLPPTTLVIPTLHLRKGLPLSFQLGVDLSYVPGSTLFVPTAWVQWSLVEGHRWIPDFHIRGLGTVLLGTGDLTEVIAGWDVGTSYRVPIAGHVESLVYLGYEQLGLSASTQNINFAPKYDNTSQTNVGSQTPLSSANVFSPLSYGNPIDPTTRLWRFYFGVQVNWYIAQLGLDFAYGSADNIIGDGFTTKYSLSAWKMGVRAGVLF